jgi:hypothetical protein
VSGPRFRNVESELVKDTVPLYPVRELPLALSALTVKVNWVPATTVAIVLIEKCVPASGWRR